MSRRRKDEVVWEGKAAHKEAGEREEEEEEGASPSPSSWSSLARSLTPKGQDAHWSHRWFSLIMCAATLILWRPPAVQQHRRRRVKSEAPAAAAA